MQIRLKVQISGTRNGQDWPRRGSVIELPDDEAAQYCAAGMAEPVAAFRNMEKAVVEVAQEQRVGSPPGLTTRNGPTKKGSRNAHSTDQ